MALGRGSIVFAGFQQQQSQGGEGFVDGVH